MQLCRFVLKEQPDQVRSGIMLDDRYYETDGDRAIGIRDPGQIALLPPVGAPPSIRAFNQYHDGHGQVQYTYQYLNSSGIHGPNASIDASPFGTSFDIDVRICGVVRDAGELIEPEEAVEFTLGYSILVVIVSLELALEEEQYSLPTGPSQDIAVSIGPFLTTPESLTEFMIGSNPTAFNWNYDLKVNDQEVMHGLDESSKPFSQLLSYASRIRRLQSADVIAWPKLEKAPMEDSQLGRPLAAGDRIEVSVDGLGKLVVNLE